MTHAGGQRSATIERQIHPSSAASLRAAEGTGGASQPRTFSPKLADGSQILPNPNPVLVVPKNIRQTQKTREHKLLEALNLNTVACVLHTVCTLYTHCISRCVKESVRGCVKVCEKVCVHLRPRKMRARASMSMRMCSRVSRAYQPETRSQTGVGAEPRTTD